MPNIFDTSKDSDLVKAAKQVFAKSLVPKPTGDYNQEFDNQTRQAPLNIVENYDLIKQLIPRWMGSREALVGKGPDTVAAYGTPNEGFNIEGAFNPKQPNQIRLSNKGLFGAIDQNPEHLNSLAHELSHFQQRANARSHIEEKPNTGWAYGAPDYQFTGEEDAQRKTFKAFPDVWKSTQDGEHYGPDAPRNEKEAQILGALMQQYFQVRQQEAYQTRRAPDLRPH